MDIKKGDTVLIIAGRDKDKRGVVLEVRPKENRIVVENCNLVTKHHKPRQARPGAHQEGRYETPAPIDRSNVMLVNPNTLKPTKISHKLVEGKWVRVARKTGEVL
ncbi:MAG TPA: 50S ribosomal protein L24 [Armatimonadota bacterium]